MGAAPPVFLSHSHRDKPVARRLARELRPRGFRVWLDESELRLGDVLGSTLRARIEEADVLVVVASAASASSTWVALEVRHARDHGKPVVPVYVEPVMTAELFREHLGVDAVSRTGFAAAARRLMVGLLGGDELPEADPAVLEAGLRALADEEPDLRPLVLGHLDGVGVGYEQTALYRVDFHGLDHALDALLELERAAPVAYSAAAAFRRTGAGAGALARWIEITGDGGLPLVTAFAEPLDPELVDPALGLLRACDPPNDQALTDFVHHNGAGLDSERRRSAISLVTWPERGPGSFGAAAATVALRVFDGAPEIVQLWRRWIWAGRLDGAPGDLARALALTAQDRVPCLDELHEALRSHVRSHLRSGDERKVVAAVDHLTANVDEGTGAVVALCAEASGVSGTSEWERWAERDPETAERMAHYVFAFLEQAEGRGDWLRAMREFERSVELARWRRQQLEGG